MRAKLLNGIIGDLMKVPMEHGAESPGENPNPKGVHVTIMDIGKKDALPAPEGEIGEDNPEGPVDDAMKNAIMERAIHAKAKKPMI